MASNNMMTMRDVTRGVVIHNDAGSMTPSQYKPWLANRDPAKGFAHYYINRNENYNHWNSYYVAYHTADFKGNTEYIGIEICESMSTSDADFLANEEAVFKYAAQLLKMYNLPVNGDTVKLHRQFLESTECPHRSVAIHGGVAATQAYFVERIMYYYNEQNKPLPVVDNVWKFQDKNNETRYIRSSEHKFVEYINSGVTLANRDFKVDLNPQAKFFETKELTNPSGQPNFADGDVVCQHSHQVRLDGNKWVVL